MVDTHPRGLQLGIRETIEVKCDDCKGTGCSRCKGTGEYFEYPETRKCENHRCFKCQGSGKRTVQLVGLVGVECPEHGCCDGAQWPEMTAMIIERFKAGTLPAEMLYDKEKRPWGLRTIEVTT